jgi:hypothetical protein
LEIISSFGDETPDDKLNFLISTGKIILRTHHDREFVYLKK